MIEIKKMLVIDVGGAPFTRLSRLRSGFKVGGGLGYWGVEIKNLLS